MNLGMGFELTDDVPEPAYDYCKNDCKNYCTLVAGELCCDTIIHMESNYQSLEFATSVAVRRMTEKGLLD
jgi:hypothetical protein